MDTGKVLLLVEMFALLTMDAVVLHQENGGSWGSIFAKLPTVELAILLLFVLLYAAADLGYSGIAAIFGLLILSSYALAHGATVASYVQSIVGGLP